MAPHWYCGKCQLAYYGYLLPACHWPSHAWKNGECLTDYMYTVDATREWQLAQYLLKIGGKNILDVMLCRYLARNKNRIEIECYVWLGFVENAFKGYKYFHSWWEGTEGAVQIRSPFMFTCVGPYYADDWWRFLNKLFFGL